jgi:hypothetical protein
MNKYLLCALLLFGNILSVVAQKLYITRDSAYICWQPGLKITSQDYQGTPDTATTKFFAEYQISAQANVGISSVLDVPAKKSERFRKFEKVYFAPTFDRLASCIKSSDTLQIAMQNLYFDICELNARWARQQLQIVQDSTKTAGTLIVFYKTIEHKMNQRRLNMYHAYFNDVFIDRQENAFFEWRKKIQQLLKESVRWQTTPEECHRLITQKVIEPHYIMAPEVVGVLPGK